MSALSAFLEVALQPLQPPLDHAQVGENDLILHRADVARAGSRDAGRMRHRRITKHPDHVQQRVGVPERRDVEQGGRSGRDAGDAADIRELHRRRDVLPGLKSAVS